MKETDNVDRLIREITAKLDANTPSTFTICSYGASLEKYRQVQGILKRMVRGNFINYTYEHYEGPFKRALFLNRRMED